MKKNRVLSRRLHHLPTTHTRAMHHAAPHFWDLNAADVISEAGCSFLLLRPNQPTAHVTVSAHLIILDTWLWDNRPRALLRIALPAQIFFLRPLKVGMVDAAEVGQTRTVEGLPVLCPLLSLRATLQVALVLPRVREQSSDCPTPELMDIASCCSEVTSYRSSSVSLTGPSMLTQ
jgi:hypothetical protein